MTAGIEGTGRARITGAARETFDDFRKFNLPERPASDLSVALLNYTSPFDQTRAAVHVVELASTNHPVLANGINSVAAALTQILNRAIAPDSRDQSDEYTLYASVLAAKAIGDNRQLVQALEPQAKLNLFSALAGLYELRDKYPLVKLAEQAAVKLDPYH